VPGGALVVSAEHPILTAPSHPDFVDGPDGRVTGEGTGTHWQQVWNLLRQAADDSNEQLIDRELLSHGVAPGDASLYRTAAEIAQQNE